MYKYNWFQRRILGFKEGKPRRKLKLDKWFMLFMALLLWSLGTMMFNYAQAIPYNLANPQIWFRMLAIIIAIFGWIWLFKIYVSSVRAKNKTTMKCPECNGEFEVENSTGRVPVFCPYCSTKGITKKGEK